MSKVGEYVSQKEFLKKNDSIVAYALYVRDNIKKDDYARLITGQIVKVTGIRENNVNKKAIYYGIYDTDWFDCSAVENFSNNIIDLIEEGDYVNGEKVLRINDIDGKDKKIFVIFKFGETEHCKVWNNEDIKSIVTKEQFVQVQYKVGD